MKASCPRKIYGCVAFRVSPCRRCRSRAAVSCACCARFGPPAAAQSCRNAVQKPTSREVQAWFRFPRCSGLWCAVTYVVALALMRMLHCFLQPGDQVDFREVCARWSGAVRRPTTTSALEASRNTVRQRERLLGPAPSSKPPLTSHDVDSCDRGGDRAWVRECGWAPVSCGCGSEWRRGLGCFFAGGALLCSEKLALGAQLRPELAGCRSGARLLLRGGKGGGFRLFKERSLSDLSFTNCEAGALASQLPLTSPHRPTYRPRERGALKDGGRDSS